MCTRAVRDTRQLFLDPGKQTSPVGSHFRGSAIHKTLGSFLPIYLTDVLFCWDYLNWYPCFWRPLGYNKVIPSPTCPKRSSSFLNARTNDMSMISLSIRWTWWDRERTAGLVRASLGSRELCFLPGAWVAGNSWFSSWFIPNMNQAVGILRLCLCVRHSIGLTTS